MATKQTLTSGYGTGLTDKQKKALSFAVHPSVSDSQDGSGGTNITSDSHRRSITLMYDGDNWQVIAGEITGTAEMVIA